MLLSGASRIAGPRRSRKDPQILDLLLSNRLRPFLLPLIALGLLTCYLEFGLRLDDRFLSVQEALEDLPNHQGEIVTAGFGRVARVNGEGFELRSGRVVIPVVGSLPGLRRGQVVSVRGRLLPEGRLQLLEARIHRGRWLKWVLGAATLTVVLATLFLDGLRGRSPGGAKPEAGRA